MLKHPGSHIAKYTQQGYARIRGGTTPVPEKSQSNFHSPGLSLLAHLRRGPKEDPNFQLEFRILSPLKVRCTALLCSSPASYNRLVSKFHSTWGISHKEKSPEYTLLHAFSRVCAQALHLLREPSCG